MAMTGVLRPGHVVLRVLDLEEGIDFYDRVLNDTFLTVLT